MMIRPWLAGAVGVTAVTPGFAAAASAATGDAASPAPGTFRAGSLHASLAPALRHLTAKGVNYNPLWAGYVAQGDKNVALRYVGADFTVPSLNCASSPSGTSGPASVVQNVGLDGFNDNAYEATGIFSTCLNGTTPSYSGWYQVGANENAVTSPVAVSPGDAIAASIYCNLGTKRFSFTLTDVTTGQAIWNTTASCPSGTTCPIDSAEAITGVANGVPPAYTLADYGMENFTGGAVTSRDGVKGGFGSAKLWGLAELGIHDASNGVVMASPSSLQGGAGFSTTWHAASCPCRPFGSVSD
jgi:Peptidase A4 family